MVNTSLTLDPSRINTYSIGFDRMFDSLMGQHPMTSNYPPYNIVKHSDDKYTIEIAVAGFSKDDIAVETKENTLTVQSKDSGVDKTEVDTAGIYTEASLLVHSRRHLQSQMMW